MAAGDTFTVDGINYEVLSDVTKVKVIAPASGSTYTGEISIPASVIYDTSTYTVTQIGSQAFKQTSITSISLPSSITYIGSRAFVQSGLVNLSINGNNLEIGSMAFSSCESLISVTLAGNISIGSSAFYDCLALTTVVIDGNISLPSGSAIFIGCVALNSMTFGPNAYLSNVGLFICTIDYTGTASALTSIIVSEDNPNYRSIDGVVFNKAGTSILGYPREKGTSYTIPETVTSIEAYAFTYNKFSTITIPSSVVSIGDGAFITMDITTFSPILCEATFKSTQPPTLGEDGIFFGADTMVSIYVPTSAVNTYKGATGFEDYADMIEPDLGIFIIDGIRYAILSDNTVSVAWDRYSFETVSVPSSVTYNGTTYSVIQIGSAAFSPIFGCTNLKSITLPDTVTTIKDRAFVAIDDYDALTSINFGNGLITIGANAIYDCVGLTSLIFPSTLATIGDEALKYCSAITTMTFNSVTPPTLGDDAFEDMDALTSIVVPSASVSAYKTAWADYADLIQAAPEPYEYLKHNGKKIQVDSAFRDGTGRLFSTKYVSIDDQQTIEGAKTFNAATTTFKAISATSISDSGTLSVTGNTSVGGTLGVTGNTTLSGTLSAGTSTLSSLAVTNNATVGGTLGVTGKTTLSDALEVTNGTVLKSTLSVTGNTTVGGTLGVGSKCTISTSGSNALITSAGSVTVSQNGHTASEVVTLGEAQTITGKKTFTASEVVLGSESSKTDLQINGDIYVNGEAYETHAQKLYTTNDYIIMRDGAVSSLLDGEYSGFQVKLYDGTTDGRLVIDNLGTARVGDVGDEQPLMTRDESANMTDGQVLIWDADNYKAVTSDTIDSDLTVTGELTVNGNINGTASSARDYTSDGTIASKFETKQDKLTAGPNIDITGVIISSPYQTKLLHNLTVSTWTLQSSPTYADYPYRADITTAVAKEISYAVAIFTYADSHSGLYAPFCDTYNGGVYLYAKSTPTTNPVVSIYITDTQVATTWSDVSSMTWATAASHTWQDLYV